MHSPIVVRRNVGSSRLVSKRDRLFLGAIGVENHRVDLLSIQLRVSDPVGAVAFTATILRLAQTLALEGGGPVLNRLDAVFGPCATLALITLVLHRGIFLTSPASRSYVAVELLLVL